MFVALLIRHAVRMRRIILLYVACMAIQYVFIIFRRSSPKYSKLYSYCQSEPWKIQHYIHKMLWWRLHASQNKHKFLPPKNAIESED